MVVNVTKIFQKMKNNEKSFPLRKCKKFLNIKTRKFHFPKYKKIKEGIFFIF